MTLQFTLPDRTAASVTVKHLLNGGYACRNPESVQAHIDELAALGVPGPQSPRRFTRSRPTWRSRPTPCWCSTAEPPGRSNGP
jgi:hypothetical protein